MQRIDDDYHFIFGLKPDFGGRPFSMIHYLAVVSCFTVNRPRAIYFHYKYEPSGPWWERARPYLTLRPIEPPAEIFGNRVSHYAHMADVLRLQILLREGGIYLDMDVLCLRPFAPLQRYEMVLGEEHGVGLCNAVILAAPGARFLEEWLKGYASFREEEWNKHSIVLPARLAREMPELIHVLDYRKFFWPMYWPEHLQPFFLRPGSSFSAESYCVHLWESVTWRELGPLTPAQAWQVDSEFALLVRPYLKPEWSEADVSSGRARHGRPVAQE